MKETTVERVVLAVLVLLIDILLYPWFIMMIWNAIVPTLFALPTIKFGQAILLKILCNCLFSSVKINTDK